MGRICAYFAISVSSAGNGFVVPYVTDFDETAPAESDQASLERALSQVASELSGAVAALRDSAGRLLTSPAPPDEPSKAT
jgi:hypothetical protein